MKLSKHAWILWTISLFITLALALLIPFVHTVVYWLALGCMGAMFLLCAYTFARAFRKDETLESKLLGFPIFKVGYAATIVQIILCFLLMALAALCPLWIAILSEILLFGCAGFCLTAKDAAREAIVQFEANIPDKTGAWKAIRSRANALAVENCNPEIRKLAEEIRYADPTPSSLDAEISEHLEILSNDASAENIQNAFSLLRQRKNLIKEEK